MTITYDGLWISVEGIDGSGKTTICEMICDYLEGKRIDHISVHDLPGTHIGGDIRKVVTENKLTQLTQLMLVSAIRSDTYHAKIKPALEAGKVVISDRCIHSSLVYCHKYFGEAFLLQSVGCEGKLPDHTFVLDIPVEVAMERVGDPDTCEDVPVEDWEKRRDMFRGLSAFPAVSVIHCGGLLSSSVFGQIKGKIDTMLEARGYHG